ncbi:MAG TPA: hypothetical protein VE981_12245 [Planctomycetota bacterium]|nr:hypothetical protein [Planctomycetota bacterium]
MIRSTDFWFGNGLYAAWYAVFYSGVAAGYLPYVPQVAHRLGQSMEVPAALSVFVIVLMCWGGPLIAFSIVHAFVFPVAGGDSFVLRLSMALGIVACGVIAVIAAAWLAGAYPTFGTLACPAILAVLFFANLAALWMARHAASVAALTL